MIIQINKHLKKIIIVFLIFFHQISLKAENYNVGQVTEDNFKIGKRVIIELPEGKFKIFDKWRINNGTMSINEYGLITPGEKRKNQRGSYELSWLITSKGKQVAEMNDG